MRVFKSAFTLAEAMIAMAIIGIVAAVTIPQVVTGSLKNEAGAVLGRTVEQIELGCQNMIQKANDNIKVTDGGYYEGLSELTQQAVFGDSVTSNESMQGENLFEYGGAFFGAKSFDGDDKYATADDYISSIRNFKGEGDRISASKKAYILEKQKAIIMVNNSANAAGALDEFTTAIFIDVNGTQKPNRGGKDVFIFGLTNQGKLIPRGTSNYQKYYAPAPLHTADCKKDAVITGWSCAARVVQDGYRITYY